MERQQSFSVKKMAKQYISKRDDSPLHSAVRSGDLGLASEILSDCRDDEEGLKGVLLRQNQSGETALYVAAEHGHIELVKELMKYYDVGSAGIKARNGYDAFHVAAKRGDLEVLKVLIDHSVQLSMTVDPTNTTALYTAAAQGHLEVVTLLLEKCGNLIPVTRNNGKTALHSAARNGHLEVVRALLSRDCSIALICDRKGQTALHMAVKGQRTDLVEELLESDPCVVNMVDNKGSTALHIATRKARAQIVLRLLKHEGINKSAVNRSGETALDIAEKSSIPDIVAIMQDHGVPSAKSINSQAPEKATRELKQTVSDIKHEVHYQLEHTRQTRRQVHGIRKRIDKMHVEGLNNAITSTTVVAVLIATVAFAAIFSVPGQYAADPDHIPSGYSLGEANAAPRPEFVAFFILDSIALFVSLAVVVVQTSVVVIERRAKRQMMAVINKLMWLACAMVSAAFLALSYVVVGRKERWLAVGVTGIGTVIMAVTLGTMCYWVVVHRIEASKLKRSARRRSSLSSRQSRSWSVSDSEIITTEYKKVYAI